MKPSTQYLLHWWPVNWPVSTPSVRVRAESRLHGAALALRHFARVGCDIGAPLAHLDITDGDGVKYTLLVEEVLHWARDEKQAAFVDRTGLAMLLDSGA
jgi:hypothetical protein